MANPHSWHVARPLEHIVFQGRIVGTRYRIDDTESHLDVFDVWVLPWQRRRVSYSPLEEEEPNSS